MRNIIYCIYQNRRGENYETAFVMALEKVAFDLRIFTKKSKSDR